MPEKLRKTFSVKALGLILAGTVAWGITMVKSGLPRDFGLGFWGPNGHDGVWHIALAESLKRGSLGMPVFGGEALQNYHIGFDLVLALFSKITLIPIPTLYFQVIPVILALSAGALTYKFVFVWTRSKSASLWSTFFVYFGGSFGWILTYARSGQIGGESLFWSQQSISTLINPPFAASFILMLLGLIFLQKKPYTAHPEKLRHGAGRTLFTAVIFGLLIQIKVYAGVLSLGALLVAGVYRRVFEKKSDVLKTFVLSLALSLAVFLPINNSSGGLVVFQPFWFLETMMQLSDRVNWPRLGEAMVNYRAGNVWHKAAAAYSVSFAVFIIGNFGTRFLGIFWLIRKTKSWRSLDTISVFIISVIGAGIVGPMFFLQEGTPWNTIQFFYYSLMFMGIVAGIVFSKIAKPALVIALLFLTLPTTVGTLMNSYIPSRPPAKLSKLELEALTFLAKEEDGIVLAFPFEKVQKEAPIDLYQYETTAYVSAYGKKNVFLEDEINLNITGYNWPERREEIEGFYETLDHAKARSFLRENDIVYVYWVRPQRAALGEAQLGLRRIFENEEVDIFRVE